MLQDNVLSDIIKNLQDSTDIMIRGYTVRSKIPIIGPLIAWIRRNLTSHLREPYVDPMFERQVDFNRKLVASLEQVNEQFAQFDQQIAHLSEVALKNDDIEHIIKKMIYDFSMIISLNDEVVGPPIREHGIWEPQVTRALLKHLRSDTQFLDIGASIGYYSLLVASQCPNGRVYSFEPDANNFRLFKASIAYNGFEAVIQPHNLAVSDENGSIVVSDLGAKFNSGAKFTGKDETTLRPYIHGPSPYFRKIDAVALDSFLKDTRIDVVKMDIEGHEPFALRGMVNLLKRSKPTIFAEFAPANLSELGQIEPVEFLDMFIDLDCEINVITENGLVSCGQEASKVIDYQERQGVHHLDLLIAFG